jgi:hypothetical protein
LGATAAVYADGCDILKSQEFRWRLDGAGATVTQSGQTCRYNAGAIGYRFQTQDFSYRLTNRNFSSSCLSYLGDAQIDPSSCSIDKSSNKAVFRSMDGTVTGSIDLSTQLLTFNIKTPQLSVAFTAMPVNITRRRLP